MANVLSDEKKQQVVALGRLGWSLRRIEEATGVRRETASGYLKVAGIAVRGPGRWGRTGPKPANEVITDSGPPLPSVEGAAAAKPANEVITDLRPQRSPAASACEPYRELIERALELGRNAMAIYQDLVSDHGFRGGY